MCLRTKIRGVTATIGSIQRIEDQSDKYFRQITLLSNEWNFATWIGLTEITRMIESTVPPNSFGSQSHIFSTVSASYIAVQLCLGARKHGRRRLLDPSSFYWSSRVAMQAKEAFLAARAYSVLCMIFPYWHHNRIAAELLDSDSVRFHSQASFIGRRVSAYLKGIRPNSVGIPKTAALAANPELQNLFDRSLQSARQISKHGVRFGDLLTLYRALYQEQERRANNFKCRYSEFKIGAYNLEDFRRFYCGVMAIAGAHEHLSFLWLVKNGTLPIETLVLKEHRTYWISLLSELTSISPDITRRMLTDTTFGTVRAENLHLLPFVPLSDSGSVLALAPPFPLSTNWEENLLQCLARADSDDYSLKSLTKEEEMRYPLVALTTGTRLITGPHKLKKGLPDVDLLVEDLNAGILIIAEMKWCRKPLGVRDRIERDKEVHKGFEQIRRIREFLDHNQSYLYDRKLATKKLLSDYRLLQYCVITRDHLVEGQEPSIPIYCYDAFSNELKSTPNTAASLRRLTDLEWLPNEGPDFSVRFQPYTLGRIRIEAEEYFLPCS
jgi:hypothetical protein